MHCALTLRLEADRPPRIAFIIYFEINIISPLSLSLRAYRGVFVFSLGTLFLLYSLSLPTALNASKVARSRISSARVRDDALLLDAWISDDSLLDISATVKQVPNSNTQPNWKC